MSHTNGKLTERQSQVLDMLKQDMTTSEIANALGITTQGVHGHMRRLREHGHLPDAPRKPRARKPISVNDSLNPLRTVIGRQREQLRRQDQRLVERAAAAADELERLGHEREQIAAALERLKTLELSMEAQIEEVASS